MAQGSIHRGPIYVPRLMLRPGDNFLFSWTVSLWSELVGKHVAGVRSPGGECHCVFVAVAAFTVVICQNRLLFFENVASYCLLSVPRTKCEIKL